MSTSTSTWSIRTLLYVPFLETLHFTWAKPDCLYHCGGVEGPKPVLLSTTS